MEETREFTRNVTRNVYGRTLLGCEGEHPVAATVFNWVVIIKLDVNGD
jgi:hypothetical protein